VVVDALDLDAPKTKLLAGKLKEWSLDNVLIVVEAIDEKLELASRNLPHVNVVTAAGVDPVSLLRHEKVLVTAGAVKRLEERFA
jgi:large subunit ribosomal protein L4